MRGDDIPRDGVARRKGCVLASVRFLNEQYAHEPAYLITASQFRMCMGNDLSQGRFSNGPLAVDP